VRYKESDRYEQADVIAIHPFLDIAVLEVRGSARPGMKINEKLEGLATGQDITLIGHVIGQSPQSDQLYQVKSTKIDTVSRHGHIIAGRFVMKGTSGGPAIMDGRLVGVVRSSGDDSSTIIPVALAIDYLRLVGIVFSEEGLARRADDISVLASRVQEYDRLLHEIQLDVAWSAAFTQSAGQSAPNGELLITYERKLQAQPLFRAKLTLGVVPLFRGDDFARLSPDKRRGFTLSNWIKDQAVRFDAAQDLEGVLNEYRTGGDGVRARMVDLIGFDIKGQVASIVGDGFIRKRIDPFFVCFEIRIKDASKSNGGRCREGLKYVDKFLPVASF
jgi:hypothetical protein